MPTLSALMNVTPIPNRNLPPFALTRYDLSYSSVPPKIMYLSALVERNRASDPVLI